MSNKKLFFIFVLVVAVVDVEIYVIYWYSSGIKWIGKSQVLENQICERICVYWGHNHLLNVRFLLFVAVAADS